MLLKYSDDLNFVTGKAVMTAYSVMLTPAYYEFESLNF